MISRLKALGGLVVLDEEGRVSGAIRGRNLALLALLARSGEAGMSRDKVAALLWPESDQDRARHSLDQALYTVRRALGSNVFLSAASALALNHEVLETDLAQRRRALDEGDLEAAVELYRGPFLDGFHLPGSGEFERWVDAERAVLHREQVDALETLARRAEERDDMARAVRHRRHQVDLEPLRSRSVLALMEALEAAGDRPGALTVAQRHAEIVAQELDAPPDPSIEAYVRELTTATARTMTESKDGDLAEANEPVSSTPSVGDSGGPNTPSRRGPLTTGVALGALALLVAVVSWGRDARPRLTASGPPVVAVLPFDNQTGEEALAPAGQMAADWITEGLLRTGLVRVADDPDGAAGVVSGRLYLEDDSLWMHARITDPTDGTVVRALDRVGSDPETPSDALEPLRQRVLGALGTVYDPRLEAWADAALRPPAYPAYRELAAGIEAAAMPRDLEAARAHFRASARGDPDFALPVLWLAWTAVMSDDYVLADSAVTALTPRRGDLSPLEAAWHDRIAATLRGDNEAAYRATVRMVEIAPRSGWVIAFANAAMDTRRPAVTVSVLERAGMESLGDEAGYGWFLLTAALHMSGQHERELDASFRGIEREGESWGYIGPAVPALAAMGDVDGLRDRLDRIRHAAPLEDGAPAGPTALQTAVLELIAHGHREEAERLMVEERTTLEVPISAFPEAAVWSRLEFLYELDRLAQVDDMLESRSFPPSWEIGQRGMEGLLFARRGDELEARRIADELMNSDEPYALGEGAYWAARIEAVRGRGSDAATLLRKAFSEGQGGRMWYRVHLTRDFEELRGDPDFMAVVRPRPAPVPLSGR